MWEPPTRVGTALATILAVLACTTGAQGAPSAPTNRLPASLWAHQRAAGSTLGIREVRRLRAQGLNTVLVDSRGWTPAAAKRLRAVATKGGLRLLVAAPFRSPTPSGGCAASRALGSAACAVEVPRVKGIRSLSRKPGVAVVVARLAGPGQLIDVRLPSRARLLAVLAVPRARL